MLITEFIMFVATALSVLWVFLRIGAETEIFLPVWQEVGAMIASGLLVSGSYHLLGTWGALTLFTLVGGCVWAFLVVGARGS